MADLISRQVAIDVEGIDEQIRCEMCRNPMHTDRGCDGHCKYDENLYKRIMQILGERIKPLPSAKPEIIQCKDCKHNPKESWSGCPMSHLSEEQRPETAWCWKGERKDDKR